jgi:hypothetical protein
MRLIVFAALVGAVACGAAPRVTVIGKDDQPVTARLPAPSHSHDSEGSIELPSDEQIVEPDHPLVDTPQERALVHVHTAKDTCSGAVLSHRLVVTASQCVGKARGPIGDKSTYVEVASSTLTWTRREVVHAVVAACEWQQLDVAVLVLNEPVEWVKPLRVTTAPSPGSRVQALGFGRCRGETRSAHERIGEVLRRENDALVIDLGLCHGDVGGVLVERNDTDVLGIISHQDEGQNASRRTTTIMRLDTAPARNLVAQAHEIARGADAAKLPAVKCD